MAGIAAQQVVEGGASRARKTHHEEWAPDFARAFEVMAALFGRTAEQATRQLPPNALDPLAVLAVVASLVTVHWLQRDTPLFERFAVPWWIESVGIAAIWLAIVMTPGTDRAFLYFQF